MSYLSPEQTLALAGGIIISLATSLNLMVSGRITGMSGIFAGLISFQKDFYYRAAFIFSMMATSILLWNQFGYESHKGHTLFEKPHEFVGDLNKTGYFIAGLLVGIGTKLGNGCTSGHGVCGIPRMALRSWVYVPIFVAFGILMATYRAYFPFLVEEAVLNVGGNEKERDSFYMNCMLIVSIVGIASSFLYALCEKFILRMTGSNYMPTKIIENLRDLIVGVLTAIIFTFGLVVSGMNKRSKIIGFLTANSQWDSSLLIVLCGAVGLNFITFNAIIYFKKTRFMKGTVDFRLILGGILFGLGWGLGGLCPGPGFVLFPFLTAHITVAWFLGLAIGQYIVIMHDKRQEMLLKSKKE